MKNKLAVFDLDGTLFDTGDVNYYAYRDALLPYGVELEKEYFVMYCNGRHYTEFLPQMLEDSDSIEAIHIAKKENYKKNIHKARVNIHLFELMKLLRVEYKLAVVTTASRKNTMEILTYFGYDSLFDLVITQEDVIKKKPDPEGFFLAMDKLGVKPGDTMIFEDSDVGLEAARASGATVFAVERF